ncbi:MAG: M55 family metallopeptidase [Candidatus Zipacnadales bacterium]
MKVYMTVDMEGVSGLVQWDPADRERERELITADVNAAIEGAFAGGATEVLVGEGHANMRNLLPERLDRRVRFLTGQPEPLNHMAGIDESFDVAMLIAYHARAGVLHGVMAHTYQFGVYSLKFNDIEVGELGTDAALAGHFGVPVGLVTGDHAACEEARELLGEVETVAVKQGISRSAAICLPLEEARTQITRAAARAIKRVDELQPFVLDTPVEVELTFVDPSYADCVEHLWFVTRSSGRQIIYEAEDFQTAFELFNAIQFLAGTVR